MSIILKSLRIRNFRGYIDSTIEFDSELNVIIGRNDVGKSTILEALEIFFSEQNIAEPADLNINCDDDKKIILNCSFTIDKSFRLIIDTSFPTQIDEEYLLNEQGLLEIQREWNCEKEKILAKDISTFIVARYPNIYDKPLVCEKIVELRKILKEVSPSTYDQTDKTKCSTIRKEIFNSLINESTIYETKLIDTSQEDAKEIWTKIRTQLPLFFLFKSDRENNDKDAEVQNPMKAATKLVISSVQQELDNVCEKVSKEIEKIGNETIEKLKELSPEIAKKLTPKVITKPFDSIFSFNLFSDDGIPLNKRGSGIRRLILLSYFRAEAEKKTAENHNNNVIYAIEEPETSQHPNYQRMIMNTLQELSKDEHYQIILTTHTPEIAKLVKLSQLILVDKDRDGCIEIEPESDRKYKSIVDTLGILPYAVSQVVICVEGMNDVNFLYNINEVIPEFNSIISLKKSNIQIIPLIGSNLFYWVNQNYFCESNIKEIHLYDNDRADYSQVIADIQNDNDGRRFGWNTNCRAMENYIPPEVIEDRFDIDLSEYKNNWKNVNVVEILSNIVRCEIVDIQKRKLAIKEELNRHVSKFIKTSSLKEIGVFEELSIFFQNVRNIVNGTNTENIYGQR